jgi:hypothetical protein
MDNDMRWAMFDPHTETVAEAVIGAVIFDALESEYGCFHVALEMLRVRCQDDEKVQEILGKMVEMPCLIAEKSMRLTMNAMRRLPAGLDVTLDGLYDTATVE